MQFKIIYLDNIARMTGNEDAWGCFKELLHLRLLGYQKEYSERVLPVGKDDFFSTHVLIFDSDRLVSTFKFTTYSACDFYNSPFPLSQVLREGGESLAAHAVDSTLQRASCARREVAYCGGWTIHPDLRKDDLRKKVIRDLVTAAHYRYFTLFGIAEALILGVIRFKADQYQEYLGYKPVVVDGNVLGEVKLKYLDSEPTRMLHLTESSEAARLVFEKYQAVFERARCLVPERPVPRGKIAA